MGFICCPRLVRRWQFHKRRSGSRQRQDVGVFPSRRCGRVGRRGMEDGLRDRPAARRGSRRRAFPRGQRQGRSQGPVPPARGAVQTAVGRLRGGGRAARDGHRRRAGVSQADCSRKWYHAEADGVRLRISGYRTLNVLGIGAVPGASTTADLLQKLVLLSIERLQYANLLCD